MKSITFILVEDSEVNYKHLFNFKECIIRILSSGNEFTFYKHEGHKGYKIKSINNLKIQDFTFSDKNNNFYIIGKKIYEKEGTYHVDLSGVPEEKFNSIMKKTTDYVNEFEYTNPENKWLILIPIEHEDCILRDDKVSPAACKHKSNIFKRCEKHICPVRLIATE